MNADVDIKGRASDRFAPVLEAFRKNFQEHDEVGASFALVKDGELVVDIWGGFLDRAQTQPWQEDTIVNVYSTTKTMTALSALLLADRGQLDLAAPVADYWPEFAAAGKEAITTAHLLSHSAGLSGLDAEVTSEVLYDWDAMTRLLAAQKPWWEPGTEPGYHAITQGYLVGEVVRRISGRSLGTFFREEIAEPLSADFHIGFGPELDARVGRLIPFEGGRTPAGESGSIADRTFRSPPLLASDSWTRAWRAAEIPAAGGHGNARSVARIQSVLASGGEAFGVRLLSPEGAGRFLEKQIEGHDLVLGTPVQYGLGYGISNPQMPVSPNPNVGFWGGWGGSTIVVDLDERMAYSYVMNRMDPSALGDPRGANLGQAVYAALASA